MKNNNIVYIYIQIHICISSFKNSLWKPDVLLYNSASQEFDTTYEVNVNVKENGWCKYGPPAIFESTCKVSSQHRTKINQQKRFNASLLQIIFALLIFYSLDRHYLVSVWCTKLQPYVWELDVPQRKHRFENPRRWLFKIQKWIRIFCK